MRMRFGAIVTLALQLMPLAAFAVTLSGAMIYSTDHYGNPNAWNAQKEEFALGQLWRTQLGGDWFGLGLLAGLPPANSDAPVLNMPNFGIQIPLVEGENDFTVVGEPSMLTRQEDFSHFALNLYFDGVLDHPGISVLFPRFSPRGGSPPLPNPAPVMYALSLVGNRAAAQSTYTDGVGRVTVTAVSFLPPEKFGVDYDKVSAGAVVPSSATPGPHGTGADGLGGFDYVGVLRIHVEGPGDAVPPAVSGVPVTPAARVVMPGVSVGPSIGGDADAGGARLSGDSPSAQGEGAVTSGVDAAVDDVGATSIAAQTATPGGTSATAESTPTRAPTVAVTRTAARPVVTPTPGATHPSGTAAPRPTTATPAAAPGRMEPGQESAAAAPTAQ